MKIGDEVYVHGFVDEIRSDVVIIRNDGGYFGTVPSEVNCSEKPNNCETCRFELYCPEMCEGCCEWDSHYEPKTEPQTSCKTCRYGEVDEGYVRCAYYSKSTEQDEPHHSGEVTEMVEPQTDGYMTAEQTEEYRKMLNKAEHKVCGNIEDEPQARMTEDDAFYIVFKDLTKDEGLFTGRYDAKHGSRQYMHGISSVMEYIAYRVGEDCLDAFNEHFVSNLIESEEKAERGE